MRKEASLEQWQSLYEVAIKLKELKPWEHLWDMDLIAILLPEYEEPFFCSVMGKAGECNAIGTYEGLEHIQGFYYVVDNPKIPFSQMVRYQNNMMCYFGNRQELQSKELKIIKDLGLKFRGKNEWIYFHSFETGYAPYTLEQSQVVKLTLVFRQLYMALAALIEEKVKVDFQEGNILLRTFEEESNLWYTYETPNFIPPRIQRKITISDELLVTKLAKNEETKDEIELDTLYINAVINDKTLERPILGNLLILADRKSGIIIDQNMLSPEDNLTNNVLNIFINYVMQKGKPKTLCVRDEYMLDLLQDLCDRIGVTIKVNEKLKVIDSFEKSFSMRGF